MKLAVIGTGKIVKEALFAASCVKEISMTAIFGRPHSRQKAADLAAQYGIAAVYTDYAALLSEADIDAVYIGLVNSAHYTYARQALEAGMSFWKSPSPPRPGRRKTWSAWQRKKAFLSWKPSRPYTGLFSENFGRCFPESGP